MHDGNKTRHQVGKQVGGYNPINQIETEQKFKPGSFKNPIIQAVAPSLTEIIQICDHNQQDNLEFLVPVEFFTQHYFVSIRDCTKTREQYIRRSRQKEVLCDFVNQIERKQKYRWASFKHHI